MERMGIMTLVRCWGRDGLWWGVYVRVYPSQDEATTAVSGSVCIVVQDRANRSTWDQHSVCCVWPLFLCSQPCSFNRPHTTTSPELPLITL
jgi:hypothetical protein